MKLNPLAVVTWFVSAMVGYLIGNTFRAAMIGFVIMFIISLLIYLWDEFKS
jgi:predicted branched-subunit amino acid permease